MAISPCAKMFAHSQSRSAESTQNGRPANDPIGVLLDFGNPTGCQPTGYGSTIALPNSAPAVWVPTPMIIRSKT